MIPAHRILRINAKDTPSEPFDLRLPSGIACQSLFAAMHRPVYLDHEPRSDNRKVNNISANRMLPPHRKPERPQLP